MGFVDFISNNSYFYIFQLNVIISCSLLAASQAMFLQLLCCKCLFVLCILLLSYLYTYSGYFTLFSSRGGGGGASRFFTNNMIFLECGVIALFEAFYMFRDHNHVKMKF